MFSPWTQPYNCRSSLQILYTFQHKIRRCHILPPPLSYTDLAGYNHIRKDQSHIYIGMSLVCWCKHLYRHISFFQHCIRRYQIRIEGLRTLYSCNYTCRLLLRQYIAPRFDTDWIHIRWCQFRSILLGILYCTDILEAKTNNFINIYNKWVKSYRLASNRIHHLELLLPEVPPIVF